jgi:P27 family predicted phage terminase small subunit
MLTGPKPKSPTLKAVEGNKGRRPIVPIPQFETGDPTPPEWLNESAKREWDRLAPTLTERGLLTEAFLTSFAMYCMAWATIEEIYKKIEAMDNLELAIAKGYINALNKTSKQMHDAVQKFGLSPVDVCRIKGIEPPKKNKLEEFLNKQKPKSA